MLEFIPAHFIVIENMREKMACVGCRESGIIVAPPPNKPFERSKAGASLITDILVKKYDDHLPLHRIKKIYSRLGVELTVPTMSGWLERIAPVIKPIVVRLWALLLACDIKQSDATGLKVLDRSVEDNIVLGTMWCNVGDGRIVVFKICREWSRAPWPLGLVQGAHRLSATRWGAVLSSPLQRESGLGHSRWLLVSCAAKVFPLCR